MGSQVDYKILMKNPEKNAHTFTHNFIPSSRPFEGVPRLLEYLPVPVPTPQGLAAPAVPASSPPLYFVLSTLSVFSYLASF